MGDAKQTKYKIGDTFYREAAIVKVTEYENSNKTYYTIRYKDTNEAVTYQDTTIDSFKKLESKQTEININETEKTIDKLQSELKRNKPHNLIENENDLPYNDDYCVFYVKISKNMTMAHMGIYFNKKFRENNLYGKEYEPVKEVVLWKPVDRFIALTENK